MNKKQNKEVLNMILKGFKEFFKFSWWVIKNTINIINKYVPKEHVLYAFWIGYCLSALGVDFIGDKVLFVAWFVTTAIIFSMTSKQLKIWLYEKGDEIAERNNN